MKRSELKEAIKSGIKSVLSENRYDINDPNSPLGRLNDEYESSGLKGIVDNYGLDVVLMMLSSGEYGDRLNENLYGRGMAPEMADTVDALIPMLTPADTIESLLDNLTDDLNELPDEVDMDFFLNNIDAIEKEMYRQTRNIRFVKEVTENVNPDLERKIVDFVRKRANEYGIPVYNAFLSIEAKMAEMKDFFGEGKYSLEEDEDEDDKKAYKGAAKRDKKKSKRDKVIDAYNEIGGGKEVKEKAKKAKEGDKEALNWLKTNQPKIKAYNDLKK